MFKQALYSYLSASSLSTLIGNRLFPQFVAEHSARPYMSYMIIGAAPIYCMRPIGTANESGLERAVVQFDIWGDTAASADAVEQSLRQVLSGYSGVMGLTTNVRRVFKLNQTEGYEPPSDGENDSLYRISVDYEFFFNSIPEGD